MRAHYLSLLGVIAWACPTSAQVRPGIEVLLADSAHLVVGKRLALLTNQTGVDRRGRRDTDLLIADGYRLMALFSPEHGFAGTEDRPGIPDATDSASRLPIYSLYGGTLLSRITALDSVDVVLIDLQDLGARPATYVASAVQLAREAARRGQRVVVLDRPNPVGGQAVEGNLRETVAEPDSLRVGFLPVAMRHGMTLGELLRLASDVLRLHADLVVVPAAGWKRPMYYDQTGLPWVRPSPNLPDLESAMHYPGLCLFEGTNLSVGRGTPLAFQVIGAPWLEPARVVRRLERARDGSREALAGVALAPVEFTPREPSDAKYEGQPVRGLRLHVTDRRRYDPTRLAVALLAALRAVAPDSFRFRDAAFDRLAAGPDLRHAILAGRTPASVWQSWEPALGRFRTLRAKYLLY